MSNSKKYIKDEQEEIISVVVPEEVSIIEPEEVKVEPEVKTLRTDKTGIIVKCSQLNIRELPNKTAPVVTILPVGTKVKVKGPLDGDWIRIYTDDVKGYAMKKFIGIKE